MASRLKWWQPPAASPFRWRQTRPSLKRCKQGICGSCLTDVLEGEPDHRDHYLTDEEKADGDQILLCCSRAKSARLIIDL